MNEVIIISGKGGAGKTSVTGALAKLMHNGILCDLDVDAPDLHLLLEPKTHRTEEFWSGNEATIRQDDCTGCGTCEEVCRFGAINVTDGTYAVDALRCEGCKVCVALCPAQAIDFPSRQCGHWYESTTRFGPMIHAQLFPGEENSGRLVTLLKQRAREIAEVQGYDIILSDGAPGIGCPVISSLSGTDLAVVVTEPTVSGRHDLERVAELCTGFRTRVAVLINKHDLNPEQTKAIEAYCQGKGYIVIGKLPHDHIVTEAMVAGKVVTEYGDSLLADTLTAAWDTVLELLENINRKEK